jgi:hypothetical protein
MDRFITRSPGVSSAYLTATRPRSKKHLTNQLVAELFGQRSQTQEHLVVDRTED